MPADHIFSYRTPAQSRTDKQTVTKTKSTGAFQKKRKKGATMPCLLAVSIPSSPLSVNTSVNTYLCLLYYISFLSKYKNPLKSFCDFYGILQACGLLRKSVVCRSRLAEADHIGVLSLSAACGAIFVRYCLKKIFIQSRQKTHKKQASTLYRFL